jgi:tetratricopeptide (TPR) repeat protein
MICPNCRTPNPDGAEACVECKHELSDAELTRGPSGTDASEAPTMMSPSMVDAGDAPTMFTPGGPRSPEQSFAAAAETGTLPEGLEVGQRYRVTRLIGRGGMGTIYEVRDQELDRDIALKVIRPEIAENPVVLERFKREIQLSSQVTHKNVLRVYDLGESEGIKFVTMQLVEGEDLAQQLKRDGKLPLEQLVDVFRKICDGLAAAHDQGVVHRDLKPHNVMLDAEGGVYLTDFGLAKSLTQTAMTQAGEMLGTPFYMSPEQVRGESVDKRSDIYALGVILYELAAGQVPYSEGSSYEVMMQRLQRAPRPVAELNPAVPDYLVKIIERCMQTDAAARYQSVQEILRDLEAEAFHTTFGYWAHKQRRWVPAVGAIVLAGALAGGGWWLYHSGRSASPPVVQQPRTVLIADFENKTGDFLFDGSLEPAFGVALEGASFVNAFNRGQASKIAAQLEPGTNRLDERLARLVAVREGVNVVTSGSVARDGNGYGVFVRAVDAVTGDEIAKAEVEVSDKEDVLAAVAKLAARIRRGLGDTTPEAVQLAAAETFTAGSLEAAHEYAVAQQQQYAGRYDEAIGHYLKAIEIDPNLGRAYSGLAVTYFNQGQNEQAENYYTTALARIDRMSDREKFRTRGGYFLIVRRDPAKAIEEYRQLVDQFPVDAAGLANLALAYFYERDMARALQEGRRAVEISPANVPQRNNVGLYAMYASDFEKGIEEQRKVLEMNPEFALAYVGLALSELGSGDPEKAKATYNELEALGERGASSAAMGLADLALFEGRVGDAVPILEQAAATDLANDRNYTGAAKLIALADAYLRSGREGDALAAVERALVARSGLNIAYPAARIYLAAGKPAKALELAERLGSSLEPDPRAYAKLIEGEAELAGGDAAAAIQDFEEAKQIADTWMGRFSLGRAYLALEAYPEANAEFDTCLRRRGEATALFLDEVPTYRLFPPLYYYQGRVFEGLNSPAAAERYEQFLAIKAEDESDPLVADARDRAAGL